MKARDIWVAVCVTCHTIGQIVAPLRSEAVSALRSQGWTIRPRDDGGVTCGRCGDREMEDKKMEITG